MYELLDPPAPSLHLGCWAKPLGRYSEIVGNSHLGSLFLRDPATQVYMVLHPLMAGSNSKNYGIFASARDFEAAILKDQSFIDQFLRPTDLRTLAARLGDLGPNQVYFPVPYPCVGGSGALATFDKGSVWVFADLLGQTLGVGSTPR